MILNFLTHSNRSDICSKPVYFISCYHTYRKANCEIPVRQTRKPLYAIGVSVRPPPASTISFQLITYVCKNDSPIVEKAVQFQYQHCHLLPSHQILSAHPHFISTGHNIISDNFHNVKHVIKRYTSLDNVKYRHVYEN